MKSINKEKKKSIILSLENSSRYIEDLVFSSSLFLYVYFKNQNLYFFKPVFFILFYFWLCWVFIGCGAQAVGHKGFSICGTQAQQLWLVDLVPLGHVGSSQIRGRMCPLHWQADSSLVTTEPPGKSKPVSSCFYFAM